MRRTTTRIAGRLGLASAVALAIVAPAVAAAPAGMSNIAGRADNAGGALRLVQDTQNAGRDCTPTNGPYGFYGNIWCQQPNVRSYERNLSGSWPQKTPPSLKKPKPHESGSDW